MVDQLTQADEDTADDLVVTVLELEARRFIHARACLIVELAQELGRSGTLEFSAVLVAEILREARIVRDLLVDPA